MQNTSPMRLAIIGTAGRDEHLISGGAAWADHLAVHAYHSGWVNELTKALVLIKPSARPNWPLKQPRIVG